MEEKGNIAPAQNWFGLITNRVFLNILFWLGFAVLPIVVNWNNFGSSANFYTDVLFYIEAGCLSYFNNFVLMPLLFDKKRYWPYFINLFLLLIIYQYISLFYLVPLGSDYLDHVSNYFIVYLYDLWDLFFVVLSLAGGRLVRKYIIQQRNLQLLKQQKSETELAFLRAQVNPHLLFNTLNMMYAHALESSPKVPDMILKLSETMRYMLYECNEKWVPLQKEIQYIENYISLQELRLEGRAKIYFSQIGSAGNLSIAPMLLIGFVENAFKHSSKGKIEDIEIKITMQIEQETLIFEVFNNLDLDRRDNNLEQGGGIGLENVRRILDLLYPDQYGLSIDNGAAHYRVQLWLNLA